MIISRKGFPPMLVTKPEFQKIILRMEASLRSQLISIIQILSGGTQTTEVRRCVIALLPSDDNWQRVPNLILNAHKVEKGMEGCKITIKRLNPIPEKVEQPEMSELLH